MRIAKKCRKKNFLLPGFAIFCIFVAGTFFFNETRFEINYHSGHYRKFRVLLGCFSFRIDESVHKEYLNFIDNCNLAEIPDRWDLCFKLYRNQSGQIRDSRTAGLYVLRLIQFCQNHLSEEQKMEVVKEFVSILKERDRQKRDYKIMEFYYRLGEKFRF